MARRQPHLGARSPAQPRSRKARAHRAPQGADGRSHVQARSLRSVCDSRAARRLCRPRILIGRGPCAGRGVVCCSDVKLVGSVGKKGRMVAVMSRREASDLYAIRGLLEGFAAREFAKRADNAAIARFGDGAKKLRAAALAGDQPGVLAAKTQLYDILLDNCGNVLVKEILTSMYSRINLLRVASLMHWDGLASSLKEIDGLFKALKARDADAAEAAARLHVANAEKTAIRMLEEKSPGSEEPGLPSGHG